MGLAMKFTWKGRIRQSLKRTVFDLTSLLNYNTKHPDRHFLTAQQVIDFDTAIADCNTLIAAKVVK